MHFQITDKTMLTFVINIVFNQLNKFAAEECSHIVGN